MGDLRTIQYRLGEEEVGGTTFTKHCILKLKINAGESGQSHHFEATCSLHNVDDDILPFVT